MKRFFSIILSIVFLMSLMANLIFATEDENQISNIAPRGTAYSSSEKNSLWTPVKKINDGIHGKDTWEGWECAYPSVDKGQDTSNGFSNEYCGINFENSFFEVSQFKVNFGLHRLLGGQNFKYELKALIEGKWQTVATFKDSDATPHNTEKYPTYEAVMKDENAGHRTLANYEVTLTAPVTSNNFRLYVSEFGKNYEGGDVQVFPYVYELELYGKEAIAPDIILPEGATATTNIAWYSYPQASSSLANHYPFLAIDENNDTYWAPNENDEKPSYSLVFDKVYSINKICLSLADNTSDLVVSVLVNGQYREVLVEPEIDKTEKGTNLCYNIAATDIEGIKVEFKRDEKIELIACEAHLSNSKTYYFNNRFDENQINSASNGNIAIIGKPYASNSFTPYSDVNYINDGLKNDKQWFTGTIDVPEHCGLTFDLPQKISKAIITVKSMYVYGIEAMSFEIQALIDGNFVKVAEGKSYSENSGYTTEYTFDEIETTDIRVVIKEMGGAIPNIAELELYNKDNSVIQMFDGIEKYVNDTVTEDDNSIDNHICAEAPNNFVPIIIGISVLVIVSVAITILIIYKKKKKEV